MRQSVIVLIFGLIFLGTLKAQNQESYLTSKLISGCPKDIEFIKNQINLSDVSYSNLETGIDTLAVKFGELNQQGQKGYWITLFTNNKLTTFTTVTLLKNKGSEFPSNIIDIKFDDSSKKISVQIMHNTSTNEIQYIWLNNNQRSEIALISHIDKPLQKNKHFPDLSFESMEGKNISTKDLEGKYVVINWWHTGCGPCRAEIPGLNKLVEKYKSNSSIVFLAVALNKKEDLENFLNAKDFNYIQTIGNKETAKLFGESFPKNMIVNPQGIITYYSEGGNENKFMDIDKELKRQLNNK